MIVIEIVGYAILCAMAVCFVACTVTIYCEAVERSLKERNEGDE